MLLILFVNNIFKLFYCDSIINVESFKINETKYFIDDISKKNEGFIGFFDWLRINDKKIIGIRICYFEDLSYNSFLLQLPFVKPAFENKCMEILFEGDTYNADLSGDQDFTNNYVFKSLSGEYLYTFGLDNLTQEELNGLIKHCKVIKGSDLIDSH